MSVFLQAQSVRNSVERSGTGQRLPGLEVEKSGTGIDVEKSGTGIDVERSGTGRRLWKFACLVVFLALAWPVAANDFSVGLTHYEGKIALVAKGENAVMLGSGPGQRGYFTIPVYSFPAIDLNSEGSGSGGRSEGSGSGTMSEGSGSGGMSVEPDVGCMSEGSGSGVLSEGSGSGAPSEGSGSGALSEGSGSGALSNGCYAEHSVQGSLWGYAEIVVTSRDSADVIFYRKHDGRLVEHSVHGNVRF